MAETGLADVCSGCLYTYSYSQSGPVAGIDVGMDGVRIWNYYLHWRNFSIAPPETAPRKDCEIGHNYEPPRLGGLVLLICGDLLSNRLEDDLM